MERHCAPTMAPASPEASLTKFVIEKTVGLVGL